MKIGFIAMSGVRAHNEELTELGLTLPGFVERNKVIASLPSLGLLTLAGMTPDTIDVEYTDVEDVNKVHDLPGEYDLVAISSYSAQIREAYELADRYRAVGTRVILGGLHVTALPQEALVHADSVVIGDGELSWPQLLHDFENDQLRTSYGSCATAFDLAEAPMPRFELLDPENYNRLTVQTSRGCPYDCEFCAASIRLSPGYRVKPVDKIIAEVRRIKEIWPKPFIEFADDNTFASKAHGKEMLRALAPEGIRWFTETDVSVGRDPELLSMMRDAGCAQVLIGFESTTREGVTGIETGSDWKARQYDSYFSSIERIQSHGISVNGCFVLGLDGSGEDSFRNVVTFARDSGLYEVQITIQTAFPGTPLYERLRDSGRLIQEEAWELCTLFDVNFVPDRMSVADLENGFRWLAEQIYSDEATSERRRLFRERLRDVLRSEQVARRKSNEPQVDPDHVRGGGPV